MKCADPEGRIILCGVEIGTYSVPAF